MISKTPWASRKFNFDFPVGYFPCIFSRLQGTSARINELVKGFSEKELGNKIENKWSVKEHIGHLTDLDELHDGRMDDYKNNAVILRPADMNNKKTNEANHNAVTSSTLIDQFTKSRNKFLKRFESTGEKELSKSALHPRLQQQMRIVDMAFLLLSMMTIILQQSAKYYLSTHFKLYWNADFYDDYD